MEHNESNSSKSRSHYSVRSLRRNNIGANVHILDEDEDREAKAEARLKQAKRRATSTLESYFEKGIYDHSQPSIKLGAPSKDKLHEADMAIAMWFYDAGIPLSAVNSPYFALAITKIASMGHGYVGPSYHELRVNLLEDAKISVSLIVDSYRKHWIETGCTIMCDRWQDSQQRHLINFFVYCTRGICFIKSVDASDIESNAEILCNLSAEIVEMVGPKNVVHVVSENSDNYRVAGGLLCEKYPTVSWSPCATYCINLILKDIGELPHVRELITFASKVTVFIYNHKRILNWLRNRPGWTEVIRSGTTRFDTTYIVLKSLYDHKSDLQAMVDSNNFNKVSEMPKAMEVKSIIMNETFWVKCLITVTLTSPLLRLLRVCESDEKPALGYVYEGMYWARKKIKKIFKNRKHLYLPYTTIIKKRWDKSLRTGLHCAAYWFNPAFQFDQDDFCQKQEVFIGVLHMIKNKTDQDIYKITMDLNKFVKGIDWNTRDLLTLYMFIITCVYKRGLRTIRGLMTRSIMNVLRKPSIGWLRKNKMENLIMTN